MAEPKLHESKEYNYRQERFVRHKYPFDPARSAEGASPAISAGVLEGTNGQAHITEDNKLVIQLFDKQHPKGMHVDGVYKIARDMVNSLLPNAHREIAMSMSDVALLALDDLASGVHGYGESPLEKATPPDRTAILGDSEVWSNLHQRLTDNNYL